MRRKYISMLLVIGLLTTILLPVKAVLASDITTASASNKSLKITIADGWKNENGAWYYYKNSTKTNGWIKNAGNWYYLGADGKMQVGWIQDGGNWYYLNSDGSMAHDTTIGGYYLGSNGAWTTASTPSSNGSVTGISYTELTNRMGSLGFIDKEYYTASDLGEDSGAYGWYWKDTTCGTASISDNGEFAIQLRKNNSEFHSTVVQIFNYLLPTQGNELDRILATNPQNETLTMDGRTVKIVLYNDAISVVISG